MLHPTPYNSRHTVGHNAFGYVPHNYRPGAHYATRPDGALLDNSRADAYPRTPTHTDRTRQVSARADMHPVLKGAIMVNGSARIDNNRPAHASTGVDNCPCHNHTASTHRNSFCHHSTRVDSTGYGIPSLYGLQGKGEAGRTVAHSHDQVLYSCSLDGIPTPKHRQAHKRRAICAGVVNVRSHRVDTRTVEDVCYHLSMAASAPQNDRNSHTH